MCRTVQNRPVNSQFMGFSFTTIRSFFYITQPTQTADLNSIVGHGNMLSLSCEKTFVCELSEFIWKDVEMRLSSGPPTNN